MKLSRSGQLLLVALLSGVCGYGLGHMGKDPAGESAGQSGTSGPAARYPQGRRGENATGSSGNLLSPGVRNLLGTEPISESSVRSETARILSETDPVRRSVAIGLILDSMTPATASSIRQAFLDSTINTGRRNNEEWFMMVRKFGSTLGQAAFDEVKGKNNPLEEALTLEGWALADSDGAFAHLQTLNHDDPGYAGKCAAVLTGIAKVDPDKSFQMILDDPDLHVDPNPLMMAALQALGMDGVTASLQNAVDRAGPEAAQSPACQSLLGSLTDDMRLQNWTSGQSERVLPWLEQLKGQPFLTDQVASHTIMDVVLQGKLTESMDWLDRMNEGQDGGRFGRDGIRSALMRDPSLLSKVDEATLDRVIAQFPPNSREMAFLAEAIALMKPDYANRLRAAGPKVEE